MQRVAGIVRSPAAAAALAAGAGTSSAHARAPTGSASSEANFRVSVVEGEDGWGYVKFRKEEVSDVITGLCSLQRGPRITELFSDDESSATTDGEADRAFYRAEPYQAEENVNNVTTVVTNLLNDPTASAAIQQALFNDPAFLAMVHRDTGTYLPSPAARPLLTGPVAVSDEFNLFAAVGGALEALLSKLADSCVFLGNALRRLPDDLRTLLRAGSGRASRGRVHSGSGQGMDASRTYEDALMGVCLAVAVVVFARRIRLA